MKATARGTFGMTEKISPPARVLIVDDEALIRWSLSERLSGAGYAVCDAGDGAAALQYFRDGESPIDLVVLDLKLPDTDGVTLLKEIKRLRPTCRMILMTAFGSPDALAEARRQGVFEVLPKPFNLDRMVTTVEQALLQSPLR
jgi:two-component system, NtrC family, response regulator AtoC